MYYVCLCLHLISYRKSCPKSVFVYIWSRTESDVLIIMLCLHRRVIGLRPLRASVSGKLDWSQRSHPLVPVIRGLHLHERPIAMERPIGLRTRLKWVSMVSWLVQKCGSAIRQDRAETGSRQHETDLQPQWEWCTSLLAIDASTYDPTECLRSTCNHTRLHRDSLATSASDLRWNRPCYDRILDCVASSFARQWSHNFCDCCWQSKTLWDNGDLTETVFDTDGEWLRSLRPNPKILSQPWCKRGV